MGKVSLEQGFVRLPRSGGPVSVLGHGDPGRYGQGGQRNKSGWWVCADRCRITWTAPAAVTTARKLSRLAG